jgi:tetrapyrrole methylase family protein/MazG family protein
MARPVIAVVGLGPAGVDLMTGAARTAIDEASAGGLPLFFRTGRHPAAEALLADGRHKSALTFDERYSLPTFDEVYSSIVSELIDRAAATGRTVYAVPGSPFVAERTVELLRVAASEAAVDLEFVVGLSFCDVAWASLGIDPITEGVRLVDAASFAVQAAGDSGPLLVAQCWSNAVLSEIKLSVDEPSADQQAVICHHLGLPDEQVVRVGWSDLDQTLEADHLTSVFIDGLGTPVAAELVRLSEAIATLRLRCPWDREQTHSSLVGHLLEESYEAIEALEALERPGTRPEDAPLEVVEHACEELGDLLCQVVFHANLAREEGLFDLADVARTISDKMVRRHPHVFGDVVAETAAAVVSNWERIKKDEKGRVHVLDGIPVALPGLARAAAIERKLAGVGLGYEVVGFDLEPAPQDDPGADLLATARRLAHQGIDAETALRRALDRLVTRVAEMEDRAAAAGRELHEIPESTRREWFAADQAEGGVH